MASFARPKISSQFLRVSAVLKFAKHNKFTSKAGKFHQLPLAPPPPNPPPPPPKPLPPPERPPLFESELPRLKPIDKEPPWLFLLKTSFKIKKNTANIKAKAPKMIR